MSTVTSATSATTSTSASSSATSTAKDLQDSFLTMLTTQLKNQDPLNPTDNAQMTSQLAQISTLEGIQSLNSTLASLLSSYNTSQALQAASAIGSTVLVDGSSLNLSGGVAQGGATLASAADSVVVTIKDSLGRVVQTQDLGKQSAGTVAFGWDGKTSDGTQLADGKYSFSVAATSGSTAVTATPVQAGTVAAVVKSGSSYVLELSSGETVNFGNVIQFM